MKSILCIYLISISLITCNSKGERTKILIEGGDREVIEYIIDSDSDFYVDIVSKNELILYKSDIKLTTYRFVSDTIDIQLTNNIIIKGIDHLEYMEKTNILTNGGGLQVKLDDSMHVIEVVKLQ